MDLLELVELRWGGGALQLLVASRAQLQARDLPRLKAHLFSVIEERSLRLQGLGQTGRTPVPALATERASDSLIEGCRREGIGLLDLRGTVSVSAPGAFIHVVGQAKVERSARARLFAGKGCRLVRLLLDSPTEVHLGLALSKRAELSYAYTNAVLTRLESEGFVTRSSPRSGYQMRDPVGLLRAWIDSGEGSAVAVEGYNAPSTSTAALKRADAALRAAGIPGIFTLASALEPEEVQASGLPHGLYLGGDARPVIEALGLRRITPHNFLILRADPAAETAAGGIYLSPRSLPHGAGVALPQLAVDFAAARGRGPEQAQALLEKLAYSLPYSAGT